MIQVKRLHEQVKLPTRGTPASIGLDVHAYLISESGRINTAIIPPRMTRLIPTGLIVLPPPGHAIFVCSRSGLAQGSIFVTNSPGIIDPDYQGEIKILLYNGHHESYYVKHDDRIAQLVVLPIPPLFQVTETLNLPETSLRGSAGFGSTGR